MAITNRERVRRGLDYLKDGLVPFVERELKSNLGVHWQEELTSRNRAIQRRGDSINWDTQAVLKSMLDNWQSVFRYVLGPVERILRRGIGRCAQPLGA